MMESPVVSVIMSVYNEESFIKEAIDSILSQSFADFELIILDDGSTDRTAEIIATYSDSRIIFIKDGFNKNQAIRANEGIAMARGRYIARMDGDDISLPQRLEKQVAYLEAHPEIDIIGSQISITTSDGKADHKYKKLPISPDVLCLYAMFFCPFIHSTVMVRKAVFDHFRYNPGYVVAQDFELFSRVLLKHKAANLDAVLVRYRRHPGNVHLESRERLLKYVREIYRSRLEKEGIALKEQELDSLMLISESNDHRLGKAALKNIDRFIKSLAIKNKQIEKVIGLIWKAQVWKIDREAVGSFLWIAIQSGAIKCFSLSDFKHLLNTLLTNPLR